MFCDRNCLLCQESGTAYVNLAEYHRVCLGHLHGITHSPFILCIHCETNVIIIPDLVVRSLESCNAIRKSEETLSSNLDDLGKCIVCSIDSRQLNDEICKKCFELYGTFIYCDCNTRKSRCVQCFDFFCTYCEQDSNYCQKCRQKQNICKNCEKFNTFRQLKCGHYACLQCTNGNCPSCVQIKCRNCNKLSDKMVPLPCGCFSCEKCITSSCKTCLDYKDVTCNDCGTSNKAIKLECGHTVCRACKTCYLCSSIINKRERCVNCNKEYNYLMINQCNHMSCENCIESPCNLCRSYQNIHCLYCNKKNPNFKMLDCLHKLCSESYLQNHFRFNCNHEVCIECHNKNEYCPKCYSKCELCNMYVYIINEHMKDSIVLCSNCLQDAPIIEGSKNFQTCCCCNVELIKAERELDCSHFSCIPCVNLKKKCIPCSSKSFETNLFCESCGERPGNNKAVCNHNVCNKCYNLKKICKACKQNLCSNCFQLSIKKSKFSCGHYGCSQCYRNKICFVCFSNQKPKQKGEGKENCNFCDSKSFIIKLACNHNICGNCFKIDLKNTEYKCPICIEDGSNKKLFICMKCEAPANWKKGKNNKFIKICCKKTICMTCLDYVVLKNHHTCGRCVII